MKTYRTYVTLLAEGEDMDRLVFSHAVFAIAMPLLIAELGAGPPRISRDPSRLQLQGR